MSALLPGQQQLAHAGLSRVVRCQGQPGPFRGPLEASRGGRRCPSLEWSSRAWPVLYRAPGSSVLLAQAATRVIWRQPPIWTCPCTWAAGTLLPSSAESAWPHPTPPRGWQGRGYRQSGLRVRVRVSLPPHLNSHDFLSHSPKPQPHRPGEASYLFSGAGGLASFQQVRFQADCLPLSPFAQSCPTLCDCSPPGSSVCGILWARIRELASIPFSRGSSQPRDWTRVSCIAGRFFIHRAILLDCLNLLKFKT